MSEGARMILSPKQRAVIQFVRESGSITVAQAVKLIGGNIYTNEAFHCGNVLRNMAKRGLLERSARGVYIHLQAPDHGLLDGMNPRAQR